MPVEWEFAVARARMDPFNDMAQTPSRGMGLHKAFVEAMVDTLSR